MNKFKSINISESSIDSFELKSKWMLVTAAKDGKVNTMTASWGGFGIMWNKEVVYVVIRPQRYTKEFVDASDSFSLTFFNNSYKKQLGYLGKVSGRDEDKISKIDLTITYSEEVPFFEEAEMVIIAKKLYSQPMQKDCFIDADDIIKRCYPHEDFHELYIAEISEILVKE